MRDQIREATARIDANPLGRLMHGQRELFHSNLLAWFFDVLPREADRAFSDLVGSGAERHRSVERERQNLDLVFRWPGRAPLVIENKVFSLPSLQQLDDYARVVAAWSGSSDATLCLLSMSRPGLTTRYDGSQYTANGWRYLSYLELAERIEQAVEAPTYESETMRRYAALVRDLHALLDAMSVASDDESVWTPDEALAAVTSSQTRAALRKARAQRVAEVVGDRIGATGRAVKFGLTNATPLVEWFGPATVGGHNLWLGWQLQGNQFRRAVVFGPELEGRSAESRDAREAVSREHPEFFAFPAALGGTPAGRKEFNHFAPGFVYRYVKVPGLTIAQLEAAAAAVKSEVESIGYDGIAPMGRAFVAAD